MLVCQTEQIVLVIDEVLIYNVCIAFVMSNFYSKNEKVNKGLVVAKVKVGCDTYP